MEPKPAFHLIPVAALLIAGGAASGARALAQQPGQGFPTPFGQRGQGQPPGPGFFGGGGQGPFGPGPGGMPMGMINPMLSTPEMAKKMASIMALRDINAAGMTSRDIGAALPVLRNMRETEKELENRSNQILDEEKKALLAAQPGSPPPPDSGQRLQQAAESLSAAERARVGRHHERDRS